MDRRTQFVEEKDASTQTGAKKAEQEDILQVELEVIPKHFYLFLHNIVILSLYRLQLWPTSSFTPRTGSWCWASPSPASSWRGLPGWPGGERRAAWRAPRASSAPCRSQTWPTSSGLTGMQGRARRGRCRCWSCWTRVAKCHFIYTEQIHPTKFYPKIRA